MSCGDRQGWQPQPGRGEPGPPAPRPGGEGWRGAADTDTQVAPGPGAAGDSEVRRSSTALPRPATAHPARRPARQLPAPPGHGDGHGARDKQRPARQGAGRAPCTRASCVRPCVRRAPPPRYLSSCRRRASVSALLCRAPAMAPRGQPAQIRAPRPRPQPSRPRPQLPLGAAPAFWSLRRRPGTAHACGARKGAFACRRRLRRRSGPRESAVARAGLGSCGPAERSSRAWPGSVSSRSPASPPGRGCAGAEPAGAAFRVPEVTNRRRQAACASEGRVPSCAHPEHPSLPAGSPDGPGDLRLSCERPCEPGRWRMPVISVLWEAEQENQV